MSLEALQKTLGGVVQAYKDDADPGWTARFPNDAELPSHAILFHAGTPQTHDEHRQAHKRGLRAGVDVAHHHMEAPR